MDYGVCSVFMFVFSPPVKLFIILTMKQPGDIDPGFCIGKYALKQA